MENCPECGAAFDKVLEERGGPTTYWKCWSYQRRNGRHFASAICDMRSLENQVDSLTAQLAALTQRAEQAERERDERQKWRDRWLTKYMELFCTVREVTEDEFMDHFGSEPEHFEALSVATGMRLDQTKLAAAEAEVKRLREGIEALVAKYKDPRQHFDAIPTRSVQALLAQPSDGKEAEDAQ